MMWGKGELTTPSGEVYRGQFKANVLHGSGERKWASGDHYTGQFSEGEREGSGTFVEATSGEVFVGQWLHGRMYGEGRVERTNGSSYSGEWVDGIPEGRGRQTWADGSFYEGPFKRNSAEGAGRKVFLDGSWFEGQFIDGEFEGHGVFHWPDGTEFEGLWRKNEIAGPGCHRFPGGTTIAGTFKDSGASGEGTKRWACGCVYTGMLLRNRIDRSGTLRWPDGRCYIGSFEDDAMHGEGTLVWLDEGGICTYRGEFDSNAFAGKGRVEWSSGARYEGAFSMGLYHGEGTFRWPGGRGIYHGSWVRGEMSGQGKLEVSNTDHEGDFSYEYAGDFLNGHMEGAGSVMFSRDGAIDHYQGDFRASRFSGRGCFVWGSGAQLEGLFEDSYCNRVGRKVYPDGRVYTGELRYDLEHGKGVMREPGGRSYVALWKDGEVVKELVMSCAPEFDLVPTEAGVNQGFSLQGNQGNFTPGSASSRSAGQPGSRGEPASRGDPGSRGELSPVPDRQISMQNIIHIPSAEGSFAAIEEGDDSSATGSSGGKASFGRPPSNGGSAQEDERDDGGEDDDDFPVSEVSLTRVPTGAQRKPLLPIIDEFGQLAEGKALVVFLNGDRYIGHMRAGRKHGRGMYVYADLETYRGVWEEDVLEGVRHPVNEDVLPVEVRRLGPADPPTPGAGSDTAPTALGVVPEHPRIRSPSLDVQDDTDTLGLPRPRQRINSTQSSEADVHSPSHHSLPRVTKHNFFESPAVLNARKNPRGPRFR